MQPCPRQRYETERATLSRVLIEAGANRDRLGFCRGAEISSASLSRWINGKTRCSRASLDRIMLHFKRSPELRRLIPDLDSIYMESRMSGPKNHNEDMSVRYVMAKAIQLYEHAHARGKAMRPVSRIEWRRMIRACRPIDPESFEITRAFLLEHGPDHVKELLKIEGEVMPGITREATRPRLSPSEVVDLIKEQGAFVSMGEAVHRIRVAMGIPLEVVASHLHMHAQDLQLVESNEAPRKLIRSFKDNRLSSFEYMMIEAGAPFSKGFLTQRQGPLMGKATPLPATQGATKKQEEAVDQSKPTLSRGGNPFITPALLEEISEYLDKHKIAMKQFCEASGVSSIYQICSCKIGITPENMVKIRKQLDIPYVPTKEPSSGQPMASEPKQDPAPEPAAHPGTPAPAENGRLAASGQDAPTMEGPTVTRSAPIEAPMPDEGSGLLGNQTAQRTESARTYTEAEVRQRIREAVAKFERFKCKTCTDPECLGRFPMEISDLMSEVDLLTPTI